MNEKRVNKKRLCCRPGCGRPAAATLVYSHAEETVIVGPLSSDGNPHSWDLCAHHSTQFRPPEGWTVIRDEPDVDDVDEFTALLDSVNDPRSDDHRFNARSGSRVTEAPQGAVADIQNTISRLNGHRHGRSATTSAEPSTMRPHVDGYAADADTDPEDDAEWEIESPLLQAAKERERRRRMWRGRGEEPTVESSHGRSVITTGQTGRHRRPDNHHASHVAPHNRAVSHSPETDQELSIRTMRHGVSDQTGDDRKQYAGQYSRYAENHADNHSGARETLQGQSWTHESSDVRHPSLHNIPGRKRGHLHAVPDPDPDGDR
ncbi:MULTISPECIES: DUF3499 family protein [Corynebacterium]|uniref:DUF3499 family protein n=1 Tax=Corynebacterium TaxID=1716 RepID=UPI00195B2293|nr:MULTISPECIES: DUF3499 family protein [Corynebacterium]MDN8623983.1 DUF3499 family protein [Corynebacterium kroppenstedtii]QRQ64220.1 DUF3499 family protein [Corynebacterium kroppenstedtii]